jgi:hypothetical protein
VIGSERRVRLTLRGLIYPPKANQYLTLSAQDVDMISYVRLALGLDRNQQAYS